MKLRRKKKIGVRLMCAVPDSRERPFLQYKIRIQYKKDLFDEKIKSKNLGARKGYLRCEYL